MSIWNQSEKDNNGVEVNYTGRNLYRLSGDDGRYDGKIESKPDGTTHYYGTNSDWRDHSHDVYDSSGNHAYSRGEGYGHSWHHRDND